MFYLHYWNFATISAVHSMRSCHTKLRHSYWIRRTTFLWGVSNYLLISTRTYWIKTFWILHFEFDFWLWAIWTLKQYYCCLCCFMSKWRSSNWLSRSNLYWLVFIYWLMFLICFRCKFELSLHTMQYKLWLLN